ncbi:hypothetical protein V8C37DRAFT_376485 [Trichoderma ceciliae]
MLYFDLSGALMIWCLNCLHVGCNLKGSLIPSPSPTVASYGCSIVQRFLTAGFESLDPERYRPFYLPVLQSIPDPARKNTASNMLSSHESLGIAQIVFYVPIVPTAIWLMRRNGKIHPRLAWWPLIPFSLMRLAGGPVLIAFEEKPSIGLYAAAIVLLNVGVVPLVIATLGYVRIVLLDNYSSNPRANKISSILRIFIFVAIGLLAAGGGVSSIGTTSSMNISRTLTLVGYIVFAVVHVVLISIMTFFWRKKHTLLPSSQAVLRGGLLASPLLIIRTVFGLLEVALENSATSPFNPIAGNAVAFGLMALLPEYIVVLTYIYTGFSIPPDRGVPLNAVQAHTATQLADKSNV